MADEKIISGIGTGQIQGGSVAGGIGKIKDESATKKEKTSLPKAIKKAAFAKSEKTKDIFQSMFPEIPEGTNNYMISVSNITGTVSFEGKVTRDSNSIKIKGSYVPENPDSKTPVEVDIKLFKKSQSNIHADVKIERFLDSSIGMNYDGEITAEKNTDGKICEVNIRGVQSQGAIEEKKLTAPQEISIERWYSDGVIVMSFNSRVNIGAGISPIAGTPVTITLRKLNE